jgi:hypothetical protein
MHDGGGKNNNNNWSWQNIVAKVVIVSSLLYAAFVTIFCPCLTLLSCHIGFFYAAVALALATAIFFNGLHCW